MHATVSVPENLVPEDPSNPGGEDLKARKARVSGLQRSGACVIASAIGAKETDDLVLREFRDLSGRHFSTDEVKEAIQAQWPDFTTNYFGQIAEGIRPPRAKPKTSIRLPASPMGGSSGRL